MLVYGAKIKVRLFIIYAFYSSGVRMPAPVLKKINTVSVRSAGHYFGTVEFRIIYEFVSTSTAFAFSSREYL